MKKIPSALALILCVCLLFSLTACTNQEFSAIGPSFDSLGFSGYLDDQAFFDTVLAYTVGGKALKDELIYENETATASVKTNLDDSIQVKITTVSGQNGTQNVYQSFYTQKALDGLTLPGGITIGSAFSDCLEALVGSKNAVKNFKPMEKPIYEMLVEERDDATLIYRDMTKAPAVTGYRYTYQLRYSDTVLSERDGRTLETARTMILSFDKDQDKPLALIEIVFETTIPNAA